MPKKGEYKKNASKETIRQRKKNQKKRHKKNRVASARARRKAGLKPKKGNTGNPSYRDSSLRDERDFLHYLSLVSNQPYA